MFGLLGPNGAGKTTTINMLTGLARPDAGTIGIGGVDCTDRPRAAQHLIGVVPDESNLYPELTGYENLTFCGALYGLDKATRTARARDLLADFGLEEAAGRKFAGYSKGMKRKLTIAAGIIHRPGILFLDEPTTGLDVAAARGLRRLIVDLHDQGTTILLTTHYIEEAEQLCDRAAFIVGGRIVRTDTIENFLRPIKGKHLLELSLAEPMVDLVNLVGRTFPEVKVTPRGDKAIRVEADKPIDVGPLVRLVDDHGGRTVEARRVKLSLEDVFVEVTGLKAQAMKNEKAKKGKGK